MIIAVLAILLAGSLAIYHYWPAEPKQKHHPIVTYSYRIVALGDSLTQGVGDEKNHGYVGMTSAALQRRKDVKKVSVDDLGHLGDTSTDLLNVLKRPQARQSIRQANTIFLTIGGNDLVRVLRSHFMDLSTSDFASQQKIFSAHLEQVFSELRKLNPNAPIYYFGLYNPFEDYLGKANRDFVPILNRWNANSKKIAGQYRKIIFIPTADIFKGTGSTLLYEDHFHPNAKGYQKLSARLLTAINRHP